MHKMAPHRLLMHNMAHASAPSSPPPPPPSAPPPPPNPLPPLPPSSPWSPWEAWQSLEFVQVALVGTVVLLAVSCLLCVGPLYCLRDRAFLLRVCTGRATRSVNVCCCLPVLCFNAYAAYLRPCLWEYWIAAFDKLVCAPLRLVCCKCCCRHTDKRFPPKGSSIGTWDGKDFEDADVEWVRATELLAYADAKVDEGGRKLTRRLSRAMRAEARVKLFEDTIDPRDLAQGSVGDCWLIAAFACAAEHPGLITRGARRPPRLHVRAKLSASVRRFSHLAVRVRGPSAVFQTKRANARGKYAVTLYDWQAKRFVSIKVDDWLPTRNGKALFAQPQGREIWVAMLEKAFAKFCGSFGALDGGSTAWALNALTGDPAFELRKQDGDTWERIDMQGKADDTNKRAIALCGKSPPEKHATAELFLLIRKYCRTGALMGASFGSYGGGGGGGLNGEDMGPQGLVAGHAYSILDAKCFHVKGAMKKARVKADEGGGAPSARLMLVQLRNPWGKGEWEGAWSDGSKEWEADSTIRAVCRPKVEDDGAFWMEWTDFAAFFSSIDVCVRSVGVADLQLDLNEADGCLRNAIGPLKGCCAGCLTYWCCCRGCAAVYRATGGTEVTIDIAGEERVYDDDLSSRMGTVLEDAARSVQSI